MDDIKGYEYLIFLLAIFLFGAVRKALAKKTQPRREDTIQPPVSRPEMETGKSLEDIFGDLFGEGKTKKEPHKLPERKPQPVRSTSETISSEIPRAETNERTFSTEEGVVRESETAKAAFNPLLEYMRRRPESPKRTGTRRGIKLESHLQEQTDDDHPKIDFDLRKAVLFSEILGKPLALRDTER